MNKDRKEVDNLLYRLDELINCKYLLADRKVAEILKAIASSTLLCDLFAFCTKDFDYDGAKTTYFVGGQMGKNGKFIRPSKDSDFLALGFSLMFDFDSKAMDLLQVAYTYFNDRDLDGCFNRFCKEFVSPFKETVKDVTYKMFAAEEESKEQTMRVQVKTEPVSKPDVGQVVAKLLSEERISVFNLKCESKIKSDYMLLIDTFESALYDGDRDAIRYAFVAYKYAMIALKRADGKVEEIEKILVGEGIY